VQGQALGGGLADSLGMIEHYEWRLTRLIENMELVCSLEVQDHSLRFSEVKLDAIVSDVVKEFKNSAMRNGATVIWSARSEDFPFIPANAEGLRQVFINLIDNAIKYSGENGEVSISLEADDSRKIISAQVSDNGPGIPREDWERIFYRGYRVEDARDRRPKEVGQGLGLYIARLIVEKHKGHISVTSELAKGTTFTITLPIQRM
jgi:two-component system phosphate regulon sensor histidine kinase PhoR